MIADRQKSAWREKKNNKEHDEKFITSGAWFRPIISTVQAARRR